MLSCNPPLAPYTRSITQAPQGTPHLLGVGVLAVVWEPFRSQSSSSIQASSIVDLIHLWRSSSILDWASS